MPLSPCLLLVRGLPGSGKSTYAKALPPEWLIYEPDHLFHDVRGVYLFDQQNYLLSCRFVERLADRALSAGRCVAIVDVFPTLAKIDRIRAIAAFHGCSFGIVECERGSKSIHDVPAYVVERMRASWEPAPAEDLLAGRAMVEVL